jgi:hypothetical protein
MKSQRGSGRASASARATACRLDGGRRIFALEPPASLIANALVGAAPMLMPPPP